MSVCLSVWQFTHLCNSENYALSSIVARFFSKMIHFQIETLIFFRYCLTLFAPYLKCCKKLWGLSFIIISALPFTSLRYFPGNRGI